MARARACPGPGLYCEQYSALTIKMRKYVFELKIAVNWGLFSYFLCRTFSFRSIIIPLYNIHPGSACVRLVHTSPGSGWWAWAAPGHQASHSTLRIPIFMSDSVHKSQRDASITRPIRGQYQGQVTTLCQSEASILVLNYSDITVKNHHLYLEILKTHKAGQNHSMRDREKHRNLRSL